jgi:hypothetical protein
MNFLKRFRVLVFPRSREATLFQRCLAVHMALATAHGSHS